MPNVVSLTHLSLQILGKTLGGISDFRISDQSLIKENCHNSRTINDIGMKLLTKLDKRNMTMSKSGDNDVMLANCDVIIIFPIYGQFGAIILQKLKTDLRNL